jgi:hypothetical protein
MLRSLLIISPVFPEPIGPVIPSIRPNKLSIPVISYHHLTLNIRHNL